ASPVASRARAHSHVADAARGGERMKIRFWRRNGDPLVCREFVELVTAYLEDTLPADERRRFAAHLAECDGCTGYLEDSRRLVAALHELPPPPTDPHTREALIAAFRDLRGPS